MPTLGNMLSAAAFFSAAARRVTGAERKGLEEAAKIIEKGAKEAIGGYSFGWPALAESTVARKGADTPLLETGALRDSISYEVDDRRAIVFASAETAPFMEYGTSRGIPPRPFIWGSWLHHEKEVLQAVGDAVVKELKL